MANASNLITNIASLMSVRLLQQTLPLVTLPYLVRVLDANGFGLVMIATAYATFHQLVVDYGFELSASRAIAQCRDDTQAVERIIRETLSGTLLALIAASIVAVTLGWMLPIFEGHMALYVGALVLSGAQSITPNWYFQGIEALRSYAVLEGITRLAGTVAIIAFINDADQYWLVPWVQVAPALIACAISLRWMARRHRPALGRIHDGLAGLTGSWRTFAFKISGALRTRMNVVILSFVVDPTIIGLYAAAEKVVQASLSLTAPVGHVMLPRLSANVTHEPERARLLARRSFTIMLAGGLAGTALLIALRDPIMETLYGIAFTEAAPLLAILACAIPFNVASNVLGVQWMLPLGLDRPFLRIIVLVAITNLIIAPIAAIAFSAMGVAWITVLAAAMVPAAMFIVLQARDLNPLKRTARQHGR